MEGTTYLSRIGTMADDGQNHSLEFDGINVKIRLSVETGRSARCTGIVSLRGAKSVEIAQGDHIWGDPRAGACMEPESRVMLA